MNYDTIHGNDFDVTNSATTLSISVEGLEGTGKTYFGLMTGPLPIVHVNFSDRDATPFLYEMSEERRQQTTLYSFKPKTTDGWTRAEGQQSIMELSQIAQEMLSDGRLAGGTFIIDSGSSWWEMIQEVYVAPLEEERAITGSKKVGGIIYGPANLVVKNMINWIKGQGAFLILTHQLTAEWDKDGPIPGRWRAKQNNQVPYMMDAVIRLSMTCDVCQSPECVAAGHVGRTHWAQIKKFGMKSSMVGMSLPSPTLSTIYTLYTGRELKGVGG